MSSVWHFPTRDGRADGSSEGRTSAWLGDESGTANDDQVRRASSYGSAGSHPLARNMLIPFADIESQTYGHWSVTRRI